MVADTSILQNCDVTSPNIGTIRASCDTSYQIQVTILCADECSNYTTISNGYSPLIVRGLDPGVRYIVTINAFDGIQVVFNDERVTKAITVINTTPSK